MWVQFFNIGRCPEAQGVCCDARYWETEASFIAGDPPVYTTTLTFGNVTVTRQRPLRDSQNRVQIAATGQWISERDWIDQEVTKETIPYPLIDRMRALAEKVWDQYNSAGRTWPSDHTDSTPTRDQRQHPLRALMPSENQMYGKR